MEEMEVRYSWYPQAEKNRSKSTGFSLAEMIVVLVVVGILISMGLAIGARIKQTAQIQLTRTELSVLASELVRLEHRTGTIPPNMTTFLQEDQQLYLQPGANGGWMVGPCPINQLPPQVLVPGAMAGPNGSTVTYVAAVNDGFGTPIQMVASPAQSPRAPFFFSAGPDKTYYTPDDIYSYSQ